MFPICMAPLLAPPTKGVGTTGKSDGAARKGDGAEGEGDGDSESKTHKHKKSKKNKKK